MENLINIVAINHGWFFEDVKKHFCRISRPGLKIIASEKALKNADVWIYLRTREASNSPDKKRTIVHIHDMYDDGYYQVNGERRVVAQCAGIVFTHPEQLKILERNGIDIDNKMIINRPIGYLQTFKLRSVLPDRFTIAWVGRPVKHKGIEIKRVGWLVEAVKQFHQSVNDCKVAFIGERLELYSNQISRMGINCDYYHRSQYNIAKYPALYQNFDCVVICSSKEAGPISLFEALATGIPVISTPIGWAPALIRDGKNGYLVNSVTEIYEALMKIYQNRKALYERRNEIRSVIEKYTMESWIEDNINLTLHLTEIKSK